jgi:type IV secretion system protein VirB9
MLVAGAVYAESVPRPLATDSRVRTVVYHAGQVVPVYGTFGYGTLIEFAPGEVVKDAAVGDSEAWNVEKVRGDTALVVKPVIADAPSNLIVHTDRRDYLFDLPGVGEKTNRAAVTFNVRFSYPDDERRAAEAAAQRQRETFEAVDPAAINMRYAWRGSEAVKPLKVFDDGTRTYFEWSGSRTPAVFAVDSGGEAVVNWHSRGRYIVVERVAPSFVIRDGKAVAEVRNEAAAESKARVKGFRPL